VSRFIREFGADNVPAIMDAITAAVQPFAADGGVFLPGSTWIVSARNA
jgi:hypothetical protein